MTRLAKYLVLPLCLAVFVCSFSAQARNTKHSKRQSKSKKVRSEAGLNIPKWGVAIDAVYDSRLDSLIPGYKILNVVLTNRGAQTIYLDPQKDKWRIRDNVGKERTAINHLRLADEKLWAALPDGLKKKIDYPQAVRTGHSTQLDLFFPSSTELFNFREISWKSAFFKKEFNVFTTMENKVNLGPNHTPIPKTSPSRVFSDQKYEGQKEDQVRNNDKTSDNSSQNKPKKDPRPDFDPILDDFTLIVE